jgi:hypothetical protein
MFVLIIDFICIVIFICFINGLETRALRYIRVYDQKNVEIRDFTIKVENLPVEMAYGGKDMMLQALLWNHFERHVKIAME